MSEHEFHVHGPHDHAIEHAIEGAHGGSAMVNQIAMFTAIIATIAAIFYTWEEPPKPMPGSIRTMRR